MDPDEGPPSNPDRFDDLPPTSGIGEGLIMREDGRSSSNGCIIFDRDQLRVKIVDDHKVTDFDISSNPHPARSVKGNP